MPDERVANDEHLVLRAEFNVAVARLEIIAIVTRPGVNGFPFENILRRDGIELCLDESNTVGVLAGDLPCIDCHANLEVVFVSDLECRLCMGTAARGATRQRCGHKNAGQSKRCGCE